MSCSSISLTDQTLEVKVTPGRKPDEQLLVTSTLLQSSTANGPKPPSTQLQRWEMFGKASILPIDSKS